LQEVDIASACFCDTDKDAETVGSLLEKTAATFHECLSLHMPPVPAVECVSTLPSGSAPKSQEILFSAIGRDVIFVARKSNCMLISPRLAPNESKRSSDTLSPMRLMNVFRPKASGIPEGAVKSHPDIKTWASEGFDCRHWMAAHLSLEALIAFDDIMNDVYLHKQRTMTTCRRAAGGIRGGFFEVLTQLPIGWIYAFADEGDNEIYMLLDIIEYPTIANAQGAIEQAKHALLYDAVMGKH
jgi:hypothetical protein